MDTPTTGHTTCATSQVSADSLQQRTQALLQKYVAATTGPYAALLQSHHCAPSGSLRHGLQRPAPSSAVLQTGHSEVFTARASAIGQAHSASLPAPPFCLSSWTAPEAFIDRAVTAKRKGAAGKLKALVKKKHAGDDCCAQGVQRWCSGRIDQLCAAGVTRYAKPLQHQAATLPQDLVPSHSTAGSLLN